MLMRMLGSFTSSLRMKSMHTGDRCLWWVGVEIGVVVGIGGTYAGEGGREGGGGLRE